MYDRLRFCLRCSHFSHCAPRLALHWRYAVVRRPVEHFALASSLVRWRTLGLVIHHPPSRNALYGLRKAGTPPPDGAVPLAGLRSKHNTYMSVPLIFFMISNHFPTVYGSDIRWVWVAVFVAVGWGVTKFLYTKSASPTPAQF